MSCDRRRPYCSQCIELGKTCSGYKTTLTWGVGVASRGKLRGLTLPISKGKSTGAADKEKIKPSGTTEARNSSNGHVVEEEVAITPTLLPDSSLQTSPTSLPTTYDFVQVDPNAPQRSLTPPPPPPAPKPSKPIHFPTAKDPNQPREQRRANKLRARRNSLQPLSVSSELPIDPFGHLITAESMGSYADMPFEHAFEYSTISPTAYQGYDAPATPKPHPEHMNWRSVSHAGDLRHTGIVVPWPPEPLSSSLGSESSSRDFVECDGVEEKPTSPDVLREGPAMSGNDCEDPLTSAMYTENPRRYVTSGGQGYAPPGALHHLGQLTPTMPNIYVGSTQTSRELINYYDKVISPVIVAFDGPTNPYRQHILRLATESTPLQHAIAALAASNLRMRRDYDTVTTQRRQLLFAQTSTETSHDASVRKSSLAHNALRRSLDDFRQETGPGRPSRQEMFHKNEAIRSLNAKLCSPTVCSDDGVLATLLVLCLYHICDTGIAKFRTQFAGVKKLLTLRERAGAHATHRETRWLITMFCWFDAMTATVNDREGQIDPGDGDGGVLDLEPDEWALENLAGCDGRLFRTISKLGRLNLLSQGKPVAPRAVQPRPMPSRQRGHDYYSMQPPPQPSEPAVRDDNQPTSACGTISLPDARALFHAEWTAIRQELLDWRFTPALIPLSMLTSPASFHAARVPAAPFGSGPGAVPPQSAPSDTTDLQHISESFRYAALLYTERLAHPRAPAAAPPAIRGAACRPATSSSRPRCRPTPSWRAPPPPRSARCRPASRTAPSRSCRGACRSR